jgi:hypothetical protein
VSGTASRVVWALVSILGLLASCREHRAAGGRSDADISVASTSDRETLREDGRLILERHCGLCHIREYPTARPGALSVFDLREPDWSARMSDAQLRSAHWRLSEPLPPDGNPNDVSNEERERFKRFVDAELERRAKLDGGV